MVRIADSAQHFSKWPPKLHFPKVATTQTVSAPCTMRISLPCPLVLSTIVPIPTATTEFRNMLTALSPTPQPRPLQGPSSFSKYCFHSHVASLIRCLSLIGASDFSSSVLQDLQDPPPLSFSFFFLLLFFFLAFHLDHLQLPVFSHLTGSLYNSPRLSFVRCFPCKMLQLPSLCLRSCLLYTSPSPRDRTRSRMPSSA